jgi:hypothetical protein
MLAQAELAFSEVVAAGQTAVPWFLVKRMGRDRPMLLVDADLLQGRHATHGILAAAMAAGMSRGGGNLLVGLGSSKPDRTATSERTARDITAFHSRPHRLSSRWRHVARRTPGVHEVGHVLPGVHRGLPSMIVPVVLRQQPDDAPDVVELCLARLREDAPDALIRIVSEAHAVAPV